MINIFLFTNNKLKRKMEAGIKKSQIPLPTPGTHQSRLETRGDKITVN